MAQSATKTQFVADLQTFTNELILAKNGLADQVNTYFKNGFNGAGSNPIVDADVAPNNLTAAKVAALITMAQNLAKFFANDNTLAIGDYEATVQAVRTT